MALLPIYSVIAAVIGSIIAFIFQRQIEVWLNNKKLMQPIAAAVVSALIIVAVANFLFDVHFTRDIINAIAAFFGGGAAYILHLTNRKKKSNKSTENEYCDD